MTINEDNVMYAQHNQRGDFGNNNEEMMVLQIVQMLNVTTVKNMDITQMIVMPRKKWKKAQI